ncbi:MAG: DUF1622 domain-containing protein [Acidobacteriota bacterium]|nr:DUF1622 domain-containing protein [Acidobacteriota bacterium]MDH3783734.1 DUF1622 domain-containing protein [Acidobacteriota bacterium]
MHEAMGDPGGLVTALSSTLEWIASAIDLIGIAIVLWGFVRALIGFVITEARRLRYRAGIGGLRTLRIDLGTYILLGIEFMIASDIIHTVVKRELQDLIFVSALVAIRTAISFFLGREVAEIEHEQAASA